MPCYPSCKKCSKFGNVTNQECTLCYSNSTLNETNCYEKCDYYYYFNSLQEYKCTINNICPDYYSKLIRNKNQCIYKCENDDKYIYEYNNECYEKCPSNTKLIVDKRLCLDDCINDNKYKYEYKNILSESGQEKQLLLFIFGGPLHSLQSLWHLSRILFLVSLQ